MAGNNGNRTQRPRDLFLEFPELDRILRDGAKRGRAETHAAVMRVLSHVGEAHAELTPGTVWARLRAIKEQRLVDTTPRSIADEEDEAILRQGYEEAATGKRRAINAVLARHPDWSRRMVWRLARTLGLCSAPPRSGRDLSNRRWTEREIERLLNRAGYDPVETIAVALGRTPDALRCKLASLGNGCKVTDSYSRRWVADTLHVGFRRVNKLLQDNLLEMRNPLIASAALKDFIASHAPGVGLQVRESVFTVIGKSSGRLTQEKIAEMLGASPEQVRSWVVRGWLPALDQRITARSFERYCKAHGSELNHAFMKRDEREWLAEEAGVKNLGSESKPVRSVHKHASVVRQCPGCRRKIRGNVYFRHVKTCAKLSTPSAATAVANVCPRVQAA